MRDVKLLV